MKLDNVKNVFENLSSINVNEHTEDKNGLTYLSWVWAWSEVKKRYPDAGYNILKFENNLPYVFDENTGYMVFTNVTIQGETKEMWLPVMDGNNKAMLNKSYTYKVKEYKDGKPTGQMIEKQVNRATMFDINKTIMRCLVKNLAMFGLGIYIYAAEDLPEGYEISKEEAENIVITFGKKHPNETLGEVLKTDKGYLEWLLSQENTKQSLKDAISKLISVPSKNEQNEKLNLMTEILKLVEETNTDYENMLKHYKVESNQDMTIEQLKDAKKELEKKLKKQNIENLVVSDIDTSDWFGKDEI